MSASWPPGRFLDLESNAFETPPNDWAVRRRRRAPKAILITLVILACLVLGIGLGFLASQGGDRQADTPGPAAEPAAGPTPGSRAASSAGVTQTEAQRAVERRLAAVALEHAGDIVWRGVADGQGIVHRGSDGATGAAASEESDAIEGTPSAVARPETPEAQADESGARDEPAREARTSDGEDGSESRRREPRRDRWSDPSVEEIDYDFSVPFEEREERSREQLLEIDQDDPYGD